MTSVSFIYSENIFKFDYRYMLMQYNFSLYCSICVNWYAVSATRILQIVLATPYIFIVLMEIAEATWV